MVLCKPRLVIGSNGPCGMFWSPWRRLLRLGRVSTGTRRRRDVTQGRRWLLPAPSHATPERRSCSCSRAGSCAGLRCGRWELQQRRRARTGPQARHREAPRPPSSQYAGSELEVAGCGERPAGPPRRHRQQPPVPGRRASHTGPGARPHSSSPPQARPLWPLRGHRPRSNELLGLWPHVFQ